MHRDEGEKTEWGPKTALTMEQNTESSLKDDSEYTLVFWTYFQAEKKFKFFY